MTILIRVLLVLCVAEICICGYRLVNVKAPIQPLLPEFDFQDPIYQKVLLSLQDKVQHQDQQALLQLGDVLLAHGYYSHAGYHYRQYLDRFPDHMPALFKLAFCLDRTGRIEQSTEKYEQLSSIKADNGEEQRQLLNLAEYAIGRNLLRLQETSMAEQAFRNNQDFIPSRVQLVKILIRSDRAADAIPHLEEMLQEVPNSLVLNFWHARALEQMDEQLAALEAYRQVERSAYIIPIDFRSSIIKPLRTSFGITALLENAGQLFSQGQLNQVSAILLKAFPQPPAQITPEYAQALQIRGDLALREQNAFALEELTSQFQKLNIYNANVINLKAGAAHFQGNRKKTEQLWKEKSLLEPSEQVYRNLWYLYHSTGREPLAQKMSSRAQQSAGIDLFRKNQPEQADALFLEAIQLDEQNELAWFYHAEMLFYLNNLKAAATAYERTLQLNPWNGRAKRALELIASINQASAS